MPQNKISSEQYEHGATGAEPVQAGERTGPQNAVRGDDSARKAEVADPFYQPKARVCPGIDPVTLMGMLRLDACWSRAEVKRKTIDARFARHIEHLHSCRLQKFGYDRKDAVVPAHLYGTVRSVLN
jgi:hypothetical protein